MLRTFYFHFCKVEAVCWHGEPNWLGWIVIGIGAVIMLFLMLIILAIILKILFPAGY